MGRGGESRLGSSEERAGGLGTILAAQQDGEELLVRFRGQAYLVK